MGGFVVGIIVLAATVLSIWGAMRLLPGVTGWRVLARAYPSRPPGDILDRGGPVSIGTMRLGGYNNCIMWVADEDFLHIRMMKIFSAGHAPMSIPFAAMTFTVDRQSRYIPVKLECGRTLTLPRRLVRRELELRAAMAASEAGAGEG
ncbi:MAG: hypothetical protein KDA21_02655 [Phycisphaerales bacterium]|nr:hypothetical protein [Phycisphaerales bacterium]